MLKTPPSDLILISDDWDNFLPSLKRERQLIEALPSYSKPAHKFLEKADAIPVLNISDQKPKGVCD